MVNNRGMSPLATSIVVASLLASLIGPSAVHAQALGGAQQATAPSVRATSSPDATDEDAIARADARHTEAVAAFGAGDLATAVEKFKAAYDADPSPAYLFNIGRVYEEMGELADALKYYERFARQPRLKLQERQQAAERIEVLRTLVPSGGSPEQGPTQESAARPDQRGDDTGPPPPPPDSDTTANDKAGRTLQIAGASLLGVGVAVALGGGLGLGLAARDRSERVAEVTQGNNPGGLTLGEVEDLDAQGRSLELWQIITAAAGGTVAATGAVLLGLGSKRRSPSKTAHVRPAVRRGFAGISVAGRF